VCGVGSLSVPVGFFGSLQGLPRMLVSRQVILFSVLFAGAMGVRGKVV
jgi:hypothetical protein